MNRSQKIHNIDLALQLAHTNHGGDFSHEAVYTGLIGPHVNIKTPQYEATVTVEHEGSIVKLETYGYVHRFADLPKFLEFFSETVKEPSHAVAELARSIGGKTMGKSVVLRQGKISYYIQETDGGFIVHANNDKIFMSGADIVAMVQA
jgi:hypothetical protein